MRRPLNALEQQLLIAMIPAQIEGAEDIAQQIMGAVVVSFDRDTFGLETEGPPLARTPKSFVMEGTDPTGSDVSLTLVFRSGRILALVCSRFDGKPFAGLPVPATVRKYSRPLIQ